MRGRCQYIYGAVHLNTTNFLQLFKFDPFSYLSLENAPFNNTNLFYRGNFDTFKSDRVIKKLQTLDVGHYSA